VSRGRGRTGRSQLPRSRQWRPWLAGIGLGAAALAAAAAPPGLQVAERWELAAPGVLATPCGPGIVANGMLAVVTAWSLSPTGAKALEPHLWLVRQGDPGALHVEPRLDGDARLRHALLLAAWPVRADRILALFALRDSFGIVEVSGGGAVRVIATVKRPAGDIEVRRLARTRDGSYVAAGRAQAAPFAMRLRDDGEVLWSQVRRDVASGVWTDVEERQDGGLVLVGQVSDAKGGAGGMTASVLARLDAQGNVVQETRQAAEQAIAVGPPERPMLLARDPQARTWGLRPFTAGADRSAAVQLSGELQAGGWLARSARLDDDSAAISELLPGLRADVAVIRADGVIRRSEPIGGVIAAPSALLAAGAEGSVLALFPGVPRQRAGGGVEGGPVLVRLTQGQ